MGDFPEGPVAKTLVPNAGGPGVIPGQGTRSSMPQVRLEMLKLKIPHATTKMLCHNNPACAITKDLVQPNKLIKLNWEKKKKEQTGGCQRCRLGKKGECSHKVQTSSFKNQSVLGI